MKSIVMTLLLVCSIFAVPCFATEAMKPLDLDLDAKAVIRTVKGFSLHSSFGGPDYYYAVIRIDGLAPGTLYEATITYEAGTGISYAMSWVSGNPLATTWRSLGGLGSGTGTGKSMPGYETKQIFVVGEESTEQVIYLVVRSDKPWEIGFSITDTFSGVTRESKNKYGYFMLDDWTNGGKSVFLLDQPEEKR